MNNKIILLLLLPFFSMKLNAQKNNVYFSAFSSPGISYRFLYKNQQTDDFLYQYRNEIEIPNYSVSAGIGAEFFVHPTLSLEVNIAYSEMSYQTQFVPAYSPPDDIILPIKSKEVYRFKMFELPFKINFTKGKNNFFFIGSFGVSPTLLLDYSEIRFFYLNNHTTSEYKVKQDELNSRFNLFISAGAGFKQKVSEKFNYKLIPEFKVGVIETRAVVRSSFDNYVGRLLWNVGINVVFSVKIK